MLPDRGWGKKAMIVRVDNSFFDSSVHFDNKKKNILVLGERPTQGFVDTAVTAEAKYSIDFTQLRKNLC